MRQARVDDYRRHLVEKPQRWKVGLQNFSFAGIPSLGELEIPFSNPFTVLCGPNGVGKSTALAALRMALSPDPETYERLARKLAGGSATVSLSHETANYELGVEFSGTAVNRTLGNDWPSTFINTGSDIHVLQMSMAGFETVEDLLNGAGSKDLKGADLTALNYIVQRDYRSIRLSEIELNGASPFFEVSYGNDTYDSRTMGSGELAAFHIWWAIERAPMNSIVLIEEPESFLSPAAQETIGNFLVARSFDKGLCTVVTSHSSPLISPLPRACIKYLYRGPSGLRLVNEPTPLSLSKIGIRKPVKNVLFVEDNAAKTFTKLLLEKQDALLASTISIEVRNGEAAIVKSLDGNVALDGPIQLYGMFDGDMRGKELAEGIVLHSMFLPGDQPIEVIFKQLVHDSRKDLAQASGIPEEKIDELLVGLQGANHHDWYEEICRGLGLSKEQLFSTLFVIWARDPDNEKKIEEWYVEISTKLN